MHKRCTSADGAQADLKHQIMLVDDEPGVLALVSILLQRSGYNVVTAKSGPVALRMLDACNPDVFILDVMMPGMDGLELCRRIRAHPRAREKPVIIFSARYDVESLRLAAEAGADAYLSKVTLHRDLLAKISELLLKKSRKNIPAN